MTTPIHPQPAAEQPTTELPPHLAAPGAGAAQPYSAAATGQHRKLSTFLKVSIILLAALSIASISLLFIGDFEGKFERVFATFVVFAIFVLLTAIDTRRDLRSDWYAPVALIANSYILALLLIVTWMTPFGFWLGWDIFWKSVLVIAVVRAVIGCCQLLISMGNGRPEPLVRFAFVTSVLAVVAGILFTAPVAIEVFDVIVPDLYWRIAVASLLLTALGLAITLLLRWSYGASEREAARGARRAQVAAQQASAPVQSAPASVDQRPALADAQPGQLLPWPTFPDGRPLPVGPDGQPDFSVLRGQ
ncbi:hypothetical protein ACR5KS_02420 [Leucobacter sp. W1153]|uniref:hypothetical protein n=1 Tax=Leucobacter sp. W1153 TaxID=3439064 RepID=UPI003F381BA2